MAPGPRPLVTLAALFGAGGSAIGPLVAERLGVEFVSQQLPATVADAMGITEDAEAGSTGEPRSTWDRLVSTFGRLSTVTGGGGGSLERLDLQDRRIRAGVEEVLARSRESGGVVLGSGGMVVLGSVPWALHVLLRGPEDARARHGASRYGLDDDDAAKRLEMIDRAHIDYVRRAYGVAFSDESLFHVTIDSTALSYDVCADVIASAAQDRLRIHTADHRIDGDT